MSALTGPRVLVADDDEAIRELLLEALTMYGYRVELAADGSEALTLFDATRPDAVVTDLTMPVMSGWGLIQGVRAIDASVPIIVLSGTTATDDLDRARAMAAVVLRKPAPLDRLREALAMVTASAPPSEDACRVAS